MGKQDIKDNVERTLVVIAMLLILMPILIQILVRYVFQASISWMEELARFSSIWAAFFGGAIALKNKKLHSIDIFTKKIDGKIELARKIISSLIIAAVLLILIVYGIQLCLRVSTQLSPALKISMSLVYLAIPVCSFKMMITLIFDQKKDFVQFKKAEGEDK